MLPVNPKTLAPSGVSAYFAAMCMGIAVVIADGPDTRGLLGLTWDVGHHVSDLLASLQPSVPEA